MTILYLYRLVRKKINKRGYNQVDLFFSHWAQSLQNIDHNHFIWLDCIYKFDNFK